MLFIGKSWEKRAILLKKRSKYLNIAPLIESPQKQTLVVNNCCGKSDFRI